MRKLKALLALMLALVLALGLSVTALAAIDVEDGGFDFPETGVDPDPQPDPDPGDDDHDRPVPPTTPTYDITVEETENGGTDSDRDSAKSGTTITITVDPEEGYVVEDVTVIVDDTATEVTVTDQGDGTYTFVMPAGDVTVTATYAPSFGPDYTGVSDLLITDQHIRYLNGYPGGTFGPGQKMTRAETAQMFYNLLRDQNVDVTVSFTDVAEDAWYAPAVNALASLGIINGVGEDTFAPDRAITRAEFTAMAMRFTDVDVAGANPFSDVPADAWYQEYVVDASELGWIGGYPDGTFRPDQTINRAEVTTIVNRMLGRVADEAYVDAHQEELAQFSDVVKAHWAYYQIVEATNAHEYTKDNNTESWTELV